MVRIAALLAVAVPLLGSHQALADGPFTPLAKQYYWVAASHAPSPTAPIDFCIAGEPSLGDFGFFILTGKSGDAEIRFANQAWKLAPNLAGDVKLAVNGNTYSLPFSSNTTTEIHAHRTPMQLIMIVGDLEAASSADITLGTGPTETEPLDGNKTVLTAFMKCNQAMNP